MTTSTFTGVGSVSASDGVYVWVAPGTVTVISTSTMSDTGRPWSASIWAMVPPRPSAPSDWSSLASLNVSSPLVRSTEPVTE